jgi:hypothetical protein
VALPLDVYDDGRETCGIPSQELISLLLSLDHEALGNHFFVLVSGSMVRRDRIFVAIGV